MDAPEEAEAQGQLSLLRVGPSLTMVRVQRPLNVSCINFNRFDCGGKLHVHVTQSVDEYQLLFRQMANSLALVGN